MFVGLFAGLFGMWFEPWMETIGSALALWQLPLEMVPSFLEGQLTLSAAVLTGCLAVSIATGLATGDFEVLFRGMFVSVVTGAVMLVPDDGTGMIAVGAGAMWVLLHTAMLTKWAGVDQPGQVVVSGNGRLI